MGRESDRGPELPAPGHTLEVVHCPVGELDVRTHHEVLDGIGHEHLVGTCQGTDAGTDVNPDARNVIVAPLDLARVQPGTDLDSERLDPVGDRLRRPDSSSWAVEGGK